MSDPRFERLRSDPRFRRPNRRAQKVVVDDRFSTFLAEDGPKKTPAAPRIDKYGRTVKPHSDRADLQRLYSLSAAREDDASEGPAVPDLARGGVLLESSDEEGENFSAQDDSDREDEVLLGKHASRPILVPRDQADLEVDLNEASYADLDAQAATYAKSPGTQTDEEDALPTRRIAVVNLDWDHVRAVHLYKIFSSPLASSPSGSSERHHWEPAVPTKRGKILSVRVYPSEYGKQRLAQEDRDGPPPELFKKSGLDADEINEESIYEVGGGADYDEDALRKYQLDRFRYYYAIVTCDTVAAGAHLHSELQGTELEQSANILDLSFVPEDMEFNDEFRDEATDVMDSTAKVYTLDFSTDALRHSKVKLSWDDEDPERARLTRRNLTRKEMEEADFRAYIASSASEDEDDRKKSATNLRTALLTGKDVDGPEGWGAHSYDKAGDMEITFTPALYAAKTKDPEDETTLERYQRRQREKRKKRKEQANAAANELAGPEQDQEIEEYALSRRHSVGSKLAPADLPVQKADRLTGDDNELVPGRKHFDMKAIEKSELRIMKKPKKVKSRQEVAEALENDFSIDVRDPRFAALHDNPAFAIDPSHPQFKKTKGMAALLEERRRRRYLDSSDALVEPLQGEGKTLASDERLKSLVASVKRHSQPDHTLKPTKRRRL